MFVFAIITGVALICASFMLVLKSFVMAYDYINTYKSNKDKLAKWQQMARG